MEPSTVLDTGNIKLILASNCPSLATVVILTRWQDSQWAELVEGDEERDPRKVCVLGDVNVG